MTFTPESENIKDYLNSSEIIDCDSENILKMAEILADDPEDEISLVKKVYEFVRDQISHSFDIQGRFVTCKASDVLLHREGICFAKSHLLAALLRNLRIPTGFCYQKILKSESDSPAYILHGLNAVYIESLGKWIRLDARGNKSNINAQFSVEEEKLAYSVDSEKGEQDDPVIYINPKSTVIEAFRNSKNLEELKNNLPVE